MSALISASLSFKSSRLLLAALCMIIAGTVKAQVPDGFDLQGHRGARGLFPENTIPAFIGALNAGVSTIEMDVVITRDGKVLVSHDPYMSADICSDSTGAPVTRKEEKETNIYKMTYAEVEQFDCGSRGNEDFPDQAKQPAAKPLLVDVIRAVEHYIRDYTNYEVDYSIELKSDKEGDNIYHPAPQPFSDTVFHVIDQYLPWKRVIIQCFDFRVLKYWHQQHPDVQLSALVENTKSVQTNLANLGFDPAIYSPEYHLLTRKAVDYLHQQGIRVIPWTVDDMNDMKRLVSWGVDGLITDFPDKATKAGFSPVPIYKDHATGSH